jgi:hypothetical protein
MLAPARKAQSENCPHPNGSREKVSATSPRRLAVSLSRALAVRVHQAIVALPSLDNQLIRINRPAKP